QDPHQSVPLHKVYPSECPFTSGSLSECPFTSGVSIRVPPYIWCPHQSAPLHQVSPSECPLTSGIPIRVPPLHQVSPSECPLTSGAPSECSLYQVPPSECPLTSEWLMGQWMHSQRPGGEKLKFVGGGGHSLPQHPP
ncbi:unnamed protein product, partial [Staurois parvus]